MIKYAIIVNNKIDNIIEAESFDVAQSLFPAINKDFIIEADENHIVGVGMDYDHKVGLLKNNILTSTQPKEMPPMPDAGNWTYDSEKDAWVEISFINENSILSRNGAN